MTSKWTSILIGVLTYVFLSVLLSVLASGAGMFGALFGCLIVIGAAMVAVWHYTSTNGVTIPGGEGAGMGALVGLLGAVIGGLLGYLLISLGAVPDPVDLAVEQFREQGMTQDEIDRAMGMTEMFSSPVVGLLLGAVFGAIGGAIGGAVGAAAFKKGGPEPDPAEPGF